MVVPAKRTIFSGGVEAVDGRIKTDGGGAAVAAVFVGVLVVLLNDEDDGTTTRGNTAGTNDGRFDIWAVMGFNVRKHDVDVDELVSLFNEKLQPSAFFLIVVLLIDNDGGTTLGLGKIATNDGRCVFNEELQP